MQSSERSCWRSLELRNAINKYTVLLYTEDTSVKRTYTFIHLTYEHFHWFFSSISWNNKNKNTKKNTNKHTNKPVHVIHVQTKCIRHMSWHI